jgi:carbamoyltransferase
VNILGVSGLEKAPAFKRAHWPGLEEREYRILQGQDSAAVLICDGQVVAAAAEERFTRNKHTAAFPSQAIDWCLSQAGLDPSQVDEIAHGFDYTPYRELYSLDPVSDEYYREVCSPEALLASVHAWRPGFPAEKVFSVNHHLAHAASAYYTSGWPECLTVVLDAMGEVQSISAFDCAGGKLKKLREISANHSIGILYSLVTLHLGFDFNSDEYKIMGLAPYGHPERFRKFFEGVVELRDGGSIRIPILNLNKTREDRETYAATRRFLDENLVPRRSPGAEITEEHRDIAAALQECLERVILHVCENLRDATGHSRIALAGGVALNCTANGRLMRSGLFEEVYIQPVAGDDGVALGAALYRASLAGEVDNQRFPVPLLGPASCRHDTDSALEEFRDRVDVVRFRSLDETCANAARLIAGGKVIAWHRGRMEYGARALGSRSILADPGHPEMRDRINAMVKKREAFRPFAPAVTAEQAHVWFELDEQAELPYMIAIVDVRPRHRESLPAITHVNGSARVQTVSKKDHPEFHHLLKAVGALNGREMVLNTSFNVKGQPIVNTPREAIDTFLGTGIEYLFLGNTRVSKKVGSEI